jgi:hypothetical protein
VDDATSQNQARAKKAKPTADEIKLRQAEARAQKAEERAQNDERRFTALKEGGLVGVVRSPAVLDHVPLAELQRLRGVDRSFNVAAASATLDRLLQRPTQTLAQMLPDADVWANDKGGVAGAHPPSPRLAAPMLANIARAAASAGPAGYTYQNALQQSTVAGVQGVPYDPARTFGGGGFVVNHGGARVVEYHPGGGQHSGSKTKAGAIRSTEELGGSYLATNKAGAPRADTSRISRYGAFAPNELFTAPLGALPAPDPFDQARAAHPDPVSPGAVDRVRDLYREVHRPTPTLPDVQAALDGLHAAGGPALPHARSVAPWNGTSAEGSFVDLGNGMVAQHHGHGTYAFMDVENELHGVRPPLGRIVTVDASGQVHASHLERER